MYSFHHIGISNLHYGLYHTLLNLSRGFWNFYGWRLISMKVETKAKTKNRYKLAYPSCLLKKDVEVNSLSLLSEHWFAFSKRPYCFPTFKQCQQTTTGGARCQNRTALLVPKTSVLPLHFILHITSPESESNRQPQIKCPPCTKRRPIVTMVLYH